MTTDAKIHSALNRAMILMVIAIAGIWLGVLLAYLRLAYLSSSPYGQPEKEPPIIDIQFTPPSRSGQNPENLCPSRLW